MSKINSGTTYVIYGKSSGFSNINLKNFTSIEGFKILGANSDDRAGTSVASAGDVNGDGLSDIILSSVYADINGRNNAGAAYVIFGKYGNISDIDLNIFNYSQGYRIIGASPYDYIGNAVSSAGDFNGDGYADVIVGAPGVDSGKGAAYIIYNSGATASPTATPTVFPTVLPSPSPTVEPTLPERVVSDIDLASINPNQAIRIAGAAVGDQTGYSVASAGDFNGDGYDDIIIGAFKSSPILRAYAGISYVLFGSSGSFVDIDLLHLPPSQGFKIFGSANEDESGYSVSGAGDFNGDGLDDIILASRKADPNGNTDFGICYIIFGKSIDIADIDLASLDSANGFRILGAANDGRTNWKVGGRGDINGDGFSDVIISSQYVHKAGRSDAGTSYVIFGKASNFAEIDLSILTAPLGFAIFGKSGSHSGTLVATVGDFNGDGYDDFVIGAALGDLNGRTNSGTSYLIFGKSSGYTNIDLLYLTPDHGFTVSGADAQDLSGHAVSYAGDINGDGFDDVIIGANGADPNSRTNAGISYVIFGKASNFTNIDLANLAIDQGFRILGASGGDNSGLSVSGAGDVNGDGYSDIVIGAYLADQNSRIDSGASYIIFGKSSGFTDIDLANLSLQQGFKILGAAAYDQSGCSVSIAGDFNGDGYADIIIGASSADPYGRSNAGAAYIIFNSAATANPTSTPSALPSATPSSEPSSSPTGSPTIEPRYVPGAIDLLYLNAYNGFTVSGGAESDWSGYSVASGDVNGDGYDDIIIASIHSDLPSRSNAGRSYVIFGGITLHSIDLQNLDLLQGIFIIGEANNDRIGKSVASGDINGDGYDDIIIGASYVSPYSRNAAGRVYIIYGSSSLSNID